jgi:hypothetical protein
MADGSLGSGSWRNTLNFQENSIRYLRLQTDLMNKPGLEDLLFYGAVGVIIGGRLGNGKGESNECPEGPIIDHP